MYAWVYGHFAVSIFSNVYTIEVFIFYNWIKLASIVEVPGNDVNINNWTIILYLHTVVSWYQVIIIIIWVTIEQYNIILYLINRQ